MYLFYALILKKFTFYQHNRTYLAGYSLLCFILPVINISNIIHANNGLNTLTLPQTVIRNIPQIGITAPTVATHAPFFNFESIIGAIALAGTVVMFIRLFISIYSIIRIRQKARLLKPVQSHKIYQVDQAIIPFSFGKSIYINKDLLSTEELQKVIAHELVHVRQKHTLDNIWAELLVAVNWFNPFAWLIRKAIKENLEYIADDYVLQAGFNKKQYQYLLLQVTGMHPKGPANSFNLSSLKNRIMMMNKNKTSKVQLLKFLFLLPLIGLLLVSFRGIISNKSAEVQFFGVIINEVNEQPLSNVTITDQANHISTTTNSEGYYSFSFEKETSIHYPIHLEVKLEGYKSPSSLTIRSLKNRDGKLYALFMANVGLQSVHSDKSDVLVLIGAAKDTKQYDSFVKLREHFLTKNQTRSSIQLAGIVFDQSSTEPLTEAIIENQAHKVIGHTDAKGFYSIEIGNKLKSGEDFRLFFKKEGYDPFLFAFSLKSMDGQMDKHILTNIGLAKLPLVKGSPTPSSASQGQNTKITYEEAIASFTQGIAYNSLTARIKATNKVLVKNDNDIWIIGKNTTTRCSLPMHLNILVNGHPMTFEEVNQKFKPQNIGAVNLKTPEELYLTTIK